MVLALSKGKLSIAQYAAAQGACRYREQVEEVLSDTFTMAGIDIGADLQMSMMLLFIGRGIGRCYEGALKLKEISYLHAEAYAAGDGLWPQLLSKDYPVITVAFLRYTTS